MLHYLGPLLGGSTEVTNRGHLPVYHDEATHQRVFQGYCIYVIQWQAGPYNPLMFNIDLSVVNSFYSCLNSIKI